MWLVKMQLKTALANQGGLGGGAACSFIATIQQNAANTRLIYGIVGSFTKLFLGILR